MTYDCFTFYNELDMLEMRLNYLSPVIDKFIIVEANKTHSGLSKPFFFRENKDRFSKFSDKIIHVEVHDMPEPVSGNRWVLENFQRRAILRGFPDLQSSDRIIMGDVDEIPSREFVTSSFEGVCSQHLFLYHINTRVKNDTWLGTAGISANTFVTKMHADCQRLRDMAHFCQLPKTEKFQGWHLTWLGSEEFILNKYSAYAHAEFDTKETRDEALHRKKHLADFFEVVNIDEKLFYDFLPYVVESFGKYTYRETK